jgi:23S rRNA (guanosine2251-2'-O)-methyltransferase
MEKRSMDALGRLSAAEFKAADKFPFVLVLDNIRSGLNVGSIFRTADAFALSKLILCGITSQPPHREILKTALGSTETVDWEWKEDVVATVQSLRQQGYKVYALEQTSQPIWLQSFEPEQGQPLAFILGNEVDGVAEQALALCDGAIEIPQFGTKHSLNVAVAAGILCWSLITNQKGANR